MAGRYKEIFQSPVRLERIVTMMAGRLGSAIFSKTIFFLEACYFELRKVFYVFKKENPRKISRCHADTNVFLARFGFSPGSKTVLAHEKYMLDDTFHSWGNKKAGLQTFCWDTNRKIVGNQWDFFQNIIDGKPDVVILSSYSRKSFFMPSARQLLWIRKKVDVPFVVLWWDTCSEGFLKSIKVFLPIFDLHIVGDNPCMALSGDPLYRENDYKFLHSYSPCSSVLHPREKDLDVSFLGHVGSYRSSRGEYIEFLMQNNVAGYYSVNVEREMRPSYEKYAEIMGRSKICINFSYSLDQDQFKGRVLEAMFSGALLLETSNEQISCLFQDGEDYISFSDKEDLLEKILYYLAHDEERERIAANGRRKVLEKYNGNLYWEKLFGHIGLRKSSCKSQKNAG